VLLQRVSLNSLDVIPSCFSNHKKTVVLERKKRKETRAGVQKKTILFGVFLCIPGCHDFGFLPFLREAQNCRENRRERKSQFFYQKSSGPLATTTILCFPEFQRNGIKIGINLNCDWTTLFQLLEMKKNKFIVLELFILFSKPLWVKIGKCLGYVPFFQRNGVKTFRNIAQRNMDGGTVNRSR